MAAGRTDEAIEGLERLRLQIKALDLAPGSPPKRPFLNDAESAEVIRRIGEQTGPITLFVGAGASIEAQLPSWVALVRRLLDEVALPKSVDRADWEAALLESGPTSAAALIQAQVRDRFPRWVYRALYADKRSRVFRPGALAEQIAYWSAEFPDAVSLVTVNYDDLLEKALIAHGLSPQPITRDGEGVRTGHTPVYHLHGYLTDDDPEAEVVLSEDDYARFPVGECWQDQLMASLLEDTMCVFVGLSFTDPNLLRWLHGASSNGDPKHIALFSRQSSPRLSAGVRGQLEAATTERWLAANVEAVFTDFFGEQAQILHEAALRRSMAGLDPFERRSADAQRRAESFFGLEEDFAASQQVASDWLRELLDAVRTMLRAPGKRLHERLGLGLWVADHAEGQLTCLGVSDRAHTDQSTVVPVSMELVSNWVSVETVTNGSPRFQDPGIYASRWGYVRGLPLVLDKGRRGRTLVGAITLTSTNPRARSVFARAGDSVLDAIDDLLTDYGSAAFEP